MCQRSRARRKAASEPINNQTQIDYMKWLCFLLVMLCSQVASADPIYKYRSALSLSESSEIFPLHGAVFLPHDRMIGHADGLLQ